MGSEGPSLYKLQLKKSAGKELKKLSRREQLEIAAILDGLQRNPQLPGCEQLNGYERYPPFFRVYCACGKHRIIYTIKEKLVLILVLKVGLRATIYADFAKMMKGIKPPPE